jgi:hypothetical protein
MRPPRSMDKNYGKQHQKRNKRLKTGRVGLSFDRCCHTLGEAQLQACIHRASLRQRM